MLLEPPSRQTLDEVPQRVFTFILGVNEAPNIRTALNTKGYTDMEQDLAWSLLEKLAIVGGRSGPTLDYTVRGAVTEIDAWDDPNFASMKATLGRLHPEQALFLFKGLTPKQGPESILGVSILLDRLDALENSPDREAIEQY